jgi:pimeloyl-ACP methyl ester carboxylesterase
MCSGESTFVEDPVSDAPWLLDIPYYVEELSALVHHLQLYEFYLYGHAWGAVIVQGGRSGQIIAAHRRQSDHRHHHYLFIHSFIPL